MFQQETEKELIARGYEPREGSNVWRKVMNQRAFVPEIGGGELRSTHIVVVYSDFVKPILRDKFKVGEEVLAWRDITPFPLDRYGRGHVDIRLFGAMAKGAYDICDLYYRWNQEEKRLADDTWVTVASPHVYRASYGFDGKLETVVTSHSDGTSVIFNFKDGIVTDLSSGVLVSDLEPYINSESRLPYNELFHAIDQNSADTAVTVSQVFGPKTFGYIKASNSVQMDQLVEVLSSFGDEWLRIRDHLPIDSNDFIED